VKRIIVVLSSVTALIALSVTLGGAAWTATAAATPAPAITSSAPSTTAVIVFDDAAQQAKLIIPTPPCTETQPDCQWKFVLQIPKGDITVGVVYGTAGTLTIAYPNNFCGVIQADAYQGPPFVPKRGFQHTISDCEPITPVSTTIPTTPVAPTTTTTEPPTPTTGAPVPPSPPAAPQVAPPVAAVPTAAPVAATPTPAPTQLPFTGVDTKPLLAIGLLLVMLGLVLLNSTASWRRMARRLLAAVHSG